jgi:hypothetical protein
MNSAVSQMGEFLLDCIHAIRGNVEYEVSRNTVAIRNGKAGCADARNRMCPGTYTLPVNAHISSSLLIVLPLL